MSKYFDNIPEVSFIGDLSLEQLQGDMVRWYQERYAELTGETVELATANPYRLILYACSLAIYQSFQYIETVGKNNLLKYSYGAFLDNIASLRGITRKEASKATTTVRFSMSGTRATVTGVPQGTRVCKGSIYFATKAYGEIAIGSTYVDIACECTEAGTAGNSLLVGEINTLVDSVPYISSVSNQTASAGGTDIEDDESLAERTFLAPSGYSTAGPSSAYEYFAKEFSSDIIDVRVVSPSAGNVSVYYILKGGVLPTSAQVAELLAYLNDSTRRPLTDNLTVSAPTTESYNIALTYYISSSNNYKASAIQIAVTKAVSNYKEWQDSTIGLDINPDELTKLVLEAGAKRVTITSPTYTVVTANKVAHCGTVTVTYGGIEDD